MSSKMVLCVLGVSALLMTGCGELAQKVQEVSYILSNEEEGDQTAVTNIFENAAILAIVDGDSDKAALVFALFGAAKLIGGEFAESLEEEDQEVLYTAQQKAAATDEEVVFENEETGVTGRVTVVDAEPVEQEEKIVEVQVLKESVQETPPLTLVSAPYKAKGSNVRGGPGTDYKVVASLSDGQVVQVIGQVKDKNWYLISQRTDSAAMGYVFGTLITPTSEPVSYVQSEGTVAKVNVQATGVCKTVRQEVTTTDGKISEDLRVCQQGDGTWKLVS